MRLMMVDLDGTLFDTKEINFRAYKDAIEPYGFTIEYDYYCEFCNGRHYTDFLPKITTTDETVLLEIHERKKKAYRKYLEYGKVNKMLVDLIISRNKTCKAALVTTASRQNTYDILEFFDLKEIFDLILTHEDITKSKPNPEGFLKAMSKYNAKAEDCVIFEDSSVGIEAAEKTGATVFVVNGFN